MTDNEKRFLNRLKQGDRIKLKATTSLFEVIEVVGDRVMGFYSPSGDVYCKSLDSFEIPDPPKAIPGRFYRYASYITGSQGIGTYTGEIWDFRSADPSRSDYDPTEWILIGDKPQ